MYKLIEIGIDDPNGENLHDETKESIISILEGHRKSYFDGRQYLAPITTLEQAVYYANIYGFKILDTDSNRFLIDTENAQLLGLAVVDIINLLQKLLKDGRIQPDGILFTVVYETGETGMITSLGTGGNEDRKNVYIGINEVNNEWN